MRFLLCFICPPMAVLFYGRPFSMVLNMGLTIFGWIPGVFHALAVHSDHRTKAMLHAINRPKWVKDQQNQGRERKGFSLSRIASPAYTKELVGDIRDIWTGKPTQPVLKDGKPQPINDPYVGAHGTRFKRAKG